MKQALIRNRLQGNFQTSSASIALTKHVSATFMHWHVRPLSNKDRAHPAVNGSICICICICMWYYTLCIMYQILMHKCQSALWNIALFPMQTNLPLTICARSIAHHECDPISTMHDQEQLWRKAWSKELSLYIDVTRRHVCKVFPCDMQVNWT